MTPQGNFQWGRAAATLEANPRTWTAILWKNGYLQTDKKGGTVRCPSTFARFTSNAANYRGDFDNDEFSFENKMTYMISGALVASDTMAGKNYTPSYKKPAHQTELKNPSSTYMMSEGIYYNSTNKDYYGAYECNVDGTSYNLFPTTDLYRIHGQQMNELLVDGHVQTTTVEELNAHGIKHYLFRSY